MCVHPKERSKGIEEMLITAATDEIQKVGTKKVFLIGPSERAELLAITNRLGFKKEFVVEGMVWKTK